MPRTIYIDADATNTTWRHIAEAGGYTHYTGRANRGDVVIRWGCNHGRYQGRYPEGVKVLNKRILLGKLEQGHCFQDAGVFIPKIYWTRAEWIRDGRPQLLIKPDVGQMGTGIRLIRDPGFRGDTLYQKYIEKQREFRAMMVGDMMAFFMEKHAPANGDFRWNEHRGAEWTSVPEDRRLRQKVKELGYKALKAVEYDFGACDIIMDREGNLYVLECNSRPEFGERNAQHFVNSIAAYIEG